MTIGASEVGSVITLLLSPYTSFKGMDYAVLTDVEMRILKSAALHP